MTDYTNHPLTSKWVDVYWFDHGPNLGSPPIARELLGRMKILQVFGEDAEYPELLKCDLDYENALIDPLDWAYFNTLTNNAGHVDLLVHPDLACPTAGQHDIPPQADNHDPRKETNS